ncbi:class I SAM-dependent methyltransferase [Haloactinopolyspora alba]|uniref:class I SAM-dependent methyltransferase n=1 Tax=Haloactinopolyspora alba TaxID=648780 RepID=UPI001F0E69DC|nr:class I SAM-dependent methyltransferase [Haloactinopolyspora alba]
MVSRLARTLGETRRQYLMVASGAVLAVAVAVAAVGGLTRWAMAAGGVLILAVLLVLLDIRRRLGPIARRIKQQTSEGRRTDDRGRGSTDATPRSRFDALSRRLMASIEAGRLEAADRHAETVDALRELRVGAAARATAPVAGYVDHAVGAESAQVATSPQLARSLANEQVREVEALLELFQRVRPIAPMPASERAATAPTGLLTVVDLVEREKPAVVVELGSGTSTAWIGSALRQAGSGRLVSLDHEPERAERTRATVGAHGLDALVTVRVVGAEALSTGAGEVMAGLDDVDMVVVGPDGVPGGGRPPHGLWARLTADALIVVDDSADDRGAARWKRDLPGLETMAPVQGRQLVLRYRA